MEIPFYCMLILKVGLGDTRLNDRWQRIIFAPLGMHDFFSAAVADPRTLSRAL